MKPLVRLLIHTNTATTIFNDLLCSVEIATNKVNAALGDELDKVVDQRPTNLVDTDSSPVGVPTVNRHFHWTQKVPKQRGSVRVVYLQSHKLINMC